MRSAAVSLGGGGGVVTAAENVEMNCNKENVHVDTQGSWLRYESMHTRRYWWVTSFCYKNFIMFILL